MSVNNVINTIQLTQGVIQTDGSGQLSASKGTNGQTLIATTGSAATWANITSTGATITITNGPNTIDLSTPASPNPLPAVFVISGEPGWPGVAQTGWPSTGGGSQILLGATGSRMVPVYDSAGNFYAGNAAGSPAVFTAPSTGKYYFSVSLSGQNQTNVFDDITITLNVITSNRTWTNNMRWGKPRGVSGQGFWSILTCIADMDSMDTATFGVTAASSSAQSYQPQVVTYPVGAANPAVIRFGYINIYLVN